MVRHEGFFSGQNFVGDNGQRELVRAAIHGVPLHLLRRHIIRSSHHDAALRHLLGENLGHSEVGDLGERAFVDQDIRGLDVAMHDALFVGVIQRLRDLAKDREHSIG